MRRLTIWLVTACLATPLAAQTDCTAGHLPYNSNEARLLRKFEAPLAFGMAGAAPGLGRGEVRVSVDVTYLPRIDSATATPTYCRPGKPPEHVNLLFGVPRPRVTIGLSPALALEVSWVPPVRVNGVKADLVGLALSRRWGAGPVAHLTARVHGTVGSIHADITCTGAQVQPSGPPQCVGGLPGPSDDRFSPNVFGAEVAMDWTLRSAVHPYVGVGYDAEFARFVTDPANTLVHQEVGGDYYRPALFGGGTLGLGRRLDATVDLYAVPGDAVTWRVGGGYRL